MPNKKILRRLEKFDPELWKVLSNALQRQISTLSSKRGDTILSFNMRKKEHCTGEKMQYNFVKFSPEPDNFRINFDKVLETAKKIRPVMIIYSPVNYPYNVDCGRFRKIADEVNSLLWIDIGQNAGLVATKKIESPIKYADVVTFAANDALHGPQTGIILSKSRFAEQLERKVIDTGHASLKKNVLAALAITFAEANCESYEDYSEQVLENARALEKGLKNVGADVICSPTENHLVLLRLSETINREKLAEKLAQANLLVKPEIFMTSDERISYPVLRLSTLDPTTRSLKEKDLYKVGQMLGKFLQSAQNEASIAEIGKVIRKMIENQPLFSEEWLPDAEIVQEMDSDLMMTAMVHWRL